MDDQFYVFSVFAEYARHIRFRTDIQRFMGVAGTFPLQFLPVPVRGRFIAEEFPPHIIVDTDNGQPFIYQETDGFSADQPG